MLKTNVGDQQMIKATMIKQAVFVTRLLLRRRAIREVGTGVDPEPGGCLPSVIWITW